MQIDWAVHCLREGANGAAQLAKVRVTVAGLNALQRSSQLRIIGDRLSEQFDLSAQCHNLCLPTMRLGCERCQRLLRVLMATDPPAYAEVSAALGLPHGSIGPTRKRCIWAK